jgi:hypothetical protein
MFRTDNATSSASPPTYPSAGTPEHFTKGNPGSGIAATLVDDWWVDQVQEEICNVITATGAALAKGTNTQLRDAILALLGGDAGILSFSSTTALLFKPKRGAGYLRVAGTAVAIPTSGLSIATTGVEVNGTGSSNLAASTTYDLYLKNSAGTLVPSFYVDAGGGTHMVDTTAGNIGTEVRSNSGTPDSARTLIGKIRTDGSSHFQQQSAGGFINWFNRRNVALNATVSAAVFSSASPAEVSTSLRVFPLCWGDESIIAVCDGNRSNSVAGTGGTDLLTLSVDGVAVGSQGGGYVAQTSSQAGNFTTGYMADLAEGFHTVSLFGAVTGGSSATLTGFTRVTVRG